MSIPHKKEDFKLGEQVHYGHSSGSRNRISFSTREGVITQLFPSMAEVKLRNGRRHNVFYERLRKPGDRTEAHEVVELMAEAHGLR